MDVGEYGAGDRRSAVMGGGGACVGSGMVFYLIHYFESIIYT